MDGKDELSATAPAVFGSGGGGDCGSVDHENNRLRQTAEETSERQVTGTTANRGTTSAVVVCQSDVLLQAWSL